MRDARLESEELTAFVVTDFICIAIASVATQMESSVRHASRSERISAAGTLRWPSVHLTARFPIRESGACRFRNFVSKTQSKRLLRARLLESNLSRRTPPNYSARPLTELTAETGIGGTGRRYTKGKEDSEGDYLKSIQVEQADTRIDYSG